MITRFALFVLLALLLVRPGTAIAGETTGPKASVFVTTSVGYLVTLDDGTMLPPGIAHGLAVLVPVRNGWGCMGEIGVTTGFSELRPAVQLIAGPSKRIAPDFALGASVLYKFVPAYDGAASPTHVLGGSVAPVFPIAIGSVSFPTGIGVNLATGDAVLAVNVKLSVRMP